VSCTSRAPTDSERRAVHGQQRSPGALSRSSGRKRRLAWSQAARTRSSIFTWSTHCVQTATTCPSSAYPEWLPLPRTGHLRPSSWAPGGCTPSARTRSVPCPTARAPSSSAMKPQVGPRPRLGGGRLARRLYAANQACLADLARAVRAALAMRAAPAV